jgi:hypothetical protein
MESTCLESRWSFSQKSIKMMELYGRVAQLGEHLLCKQGVRGSNPLTSTNHHHFNQMPSEFSRVTTCYSGRGRESECLINRLQPVARPRHNFRIRPDSQARRSNWL